MGSVPGWTVARTRKNTSYVLARGAVATDIFDSKTHYSGQNVHLLRASNRWRMMKNKLYSLLYEVQQPNKFISPDN